MLSLIWAQDKNRGIGKNGKIPWSISDDVKFFKATTINHTVVMGRRTFDSIGRPLPKRNNLVLSHHTEDLSAGVEAFSDVQSLKLRVKQLQNQNESIYIIGGALLYDIFLPEADQLLITRVNQDYNCDTFAPSIPTNLFQLQKVTNGIGEPQHTFETWVKA